MIKMIKCSHPSVKFFDVCPDFKGETGCGSNSFCKYKIFENNEGNILLQEWPTLYTKSSTGKISRWRITVQTIEGVPYILRESGFIDGEITTAKKSITEGKNVGKSNETTPEEQACKDALSMWNKKKLEQYVEDINEVNNINPIVLPMLAHTFQDRKHDIEWPALVQPKLNGVRCLTQSVDGQIKYTSRQGKTWEFFKHLDKDVQLIINEVGILDGEIFAMHLGFQEITRLIKKERTNNDELEYWIYDYVDESTPFSERTNKLYKLFVKFGERDGKFLKIGKLVLTPTREAISEAEVYQYHDKYVSEGYEGVMIRNKNSPYVIKHRTQHLQKYKEFKDEEFEIIGGEEATGEDKGTVIFKCKTNSGVEFNVRPEGTREQRAIWLQNLNSLIGKKLSVKFQAWTEDGKPQFPSGINIRDYEN
jgi:ATP-dependent DNA ligase